MGIQSVPNEKQIEKMNTFARIWNNTTGYPAYYDMERALKITHKTLLKKVRDYQEYRKKYPELELPLLVVRRTKSGFVANLPDAIAEQLDEFRIDTALLESASGVIVTSAQFGGTLNRSAWNSLLKYAKYRDFPLVVLPIMYGNIKIDDEDRLTSTFPDLLKGHMLFDDYVFCGGELTLNTTRMRPTLHRFLTDSICEIGGNSAQIFAAPKLELEHRPRVGRKYPKAIMTTGAVTYPSYSMNKLGQQDRTGEIATKEHNYAAIIVEFQGRRFQFRQLHTTKNGYFYDIDANRGGAVYCTSRGVQHRPDDVSALVCGDWHTGKTDPSVRRATFGRNGLVGKLMPNDIVFHDFVDCDSVSHWDQHESVRRGYKAPRGLNNLRTELDEAVAELKYIKTRTKAKLHIIASNHNEFVRKYIEHLDWVHDDMNLDMGAYLYSMMLEDLKSRAPSRHQIRAIDPVGWYLMKHVPGIIAHDRQDTLLLPRGSKKAILCSMHGDIGVSGVRASGLNNFRKMNRRMTIGHAHWAAILGPIWRVGTSTYRMESYVNGPATNWTNTHQLIYKNGQRQLINIVNGKWHFLKR